MEQLQKRPSKKQRELLSFIEGFITGHGYGPSYREIMRALNYKSVSTVATHVDNLIAGRHMRKRDHSARSLEVVKGTIAPEQTKTMPVLETQAKWLVSIINARFKDVETQATAKKIDELYVLVGALHILGLDDAHTAAKSRLIALTKPKS